MYSLKIAFRNLKRNGLYSWINVIGLAVSLTASVLILLWIVDEWSYDKFHKKYKDICLSIASFDMGGKKLHWNVSSPGLGTVAQEEIPEIENACRILHYWNDVEYLKFENQIFNDISFALVDATFFSIFDLSILHQEQSNLLPDKTSVVISESVAKVLFGEEDPLGKTIIDAAHRTFHVTAIIKDMPHNSSNYYNVIFSFDLYESSIPDLKSMWGNLNYKTYFLLRKGVDREKIAQQLTDIHLRNNAWEITYSLQPLEDEHFYNADGTPGTTLQSLRLFVITVFVLLLIACVNYVNLVTARASHRSKEIIVRKIMGAKKTSLFFQFFNESLLLFLFSLLAATFLIYLLVPAYNQITDKELIFSPFSSSALFAYGMVFFATIFFAGIYPAYFLSQKENQNEELSNKKGKGILRKSLVTLQFTASTILIMAALTFGGQMRFIRKSDPGYEKEHIFYVQLSKNTRRHVNGMKTRLLQNPSINGVSVLSQPLGNIIQFNSGGEWIGKGDKKITFNVVNTDADFLSVFGIKLIEGQSFTGLPSDSAAFIFNEEAIVQMELEKPVGKPFSIEGVDGFIAGIVEDFHFRSMRQPIEPLIIRVKPWINYLYVKSTAGNIDGALKVVEEIYKTYDADTPFAYRFIDDEFERMYKTDIRMEKMFNYFAIIAIFISCLGLFGLVTYTAETKTKEIGIRKVLGASIGNIVGMLSKEFLVLVVIAMLIAFPLAYYWLNEMLKDYAYRIDISLKLFALTTFLILVLTFLTVSFQAIRAATANPVNSIKN